MPTQQMPLNLPFGGPIDVNSGPVSISSPQGAPSMYQNVANPSSAPSPSVAGPGANPPSNSDGGLNLGSLVSSIGGPLVSGGLSLLGGLLQMGGQQSSINQQEAFQQQMSSTAYQRAVTDMKAAGLNPALMYGSGGPESTPSGASMTPPNVLGQVASSAMDAINLQNQMRMQSAQINSINATAAKTLVDAQLSRAELPYAKSMSDFYSKNPAMGPLDSTMGTIGKAVGNTAEGLGLFKLLSAGKSAAVAPGAGLGIGGDLGGVASEIGGAAALIP